MAAVLNVHERTLAASPRQVGVLFDSLASPGDAVWPRQCWPRMKLDRPLAVGAAGGHGPIRYVVEEYAPGQSIRFRFTGPRGFDGYHALEVISAAPATVLRHTLAMTTHGWARLSWPLAFRPLHDALIEDGLATAEASLGLPSQLRPWSPWVRFLRWAMTGGRAPRQTTPGFPPPATSPTLTKERA